MWLSRRPRPKHPNANLDWASAIVNTLAAPMECPRWSERVALALSAAAAAFGLVLQGVSENTVN
jgi:hypothetical protein